MDDVHHIVYDASYLVLVLGDVYLGAPVATPIDPRHRLVTTKYNPARTWTPENAVALGARICACTEWRVRAGYQFVGRTLQNVEPHFTLLPSFSPAHRGCSVPSIRFVSFRVTADELLEIRDAFLAWPISLRMEDQPIPFA